MKTPENEIEDLQLEIDRLKKEHGKLLAIISPVKTTWDISIDHYDGEKTLMATLRDHRQFFIKKTGETVMCNGMQFCSLDSAMNYCEREVMA